MITGIVGWPGAGKTYTGVKMLLEQFRQGARRGMPPQVYANMAGLSCPEAIYYDGLADFVDVSNGLVLMDEAGVFLSSRYWQQVPRELLMSLAQVRKNGLDLIWVTQHEARIDTVLRELTSNIIRCRAFGRYTIAQTEDATSKTVIRKQVYRRVPLVWNLFDTLEVIGTDGGTAGRGAAARSRASDAALATQRSAVNAAAARNRAALMRWYCKTGRLTLEARDAGEYLTGQGVCLAGSAGWAECVRAEIARRRWLAVWGLGPHDAPLDCTPSSPWLFNHSPKDARLRREALQELESMKERSKKRK